MESQLREANLSNAISIICIAFGFLHAFPSVERHIVYTNTETNNLLQASPP